MPYLARNLSLLVAIFFSFLIFIFLLTQSVILHCRWHSSWHWRRCCTAWHWRHGRRHGWSKERLQYLYLSGRCPCWHSVHPYHALLGKLLVGSHLLAGSPVVWTIVLPVDIPIEGNHWVWHWWSKWWWNGCTWRRWRGSGTWSCYWLCCLWLSIRLCSLWLGRLGERLSGLCIRLSGLWLLCCCLLCSVSLFCCLDFFIASCKERWEL